MRIRYVATRSDQQMEEKEPMDVPLPLTRCGLFFCSTRSSITAAIPTLYQPSSIPIRNMYLLGDDRLYITQEDLDLNNPVAIEFASDPFSHMN